MAKDSIRIGQRLLERNPGMDIETFTETMKHAALRDPELMKDILENIAGHVIRIGKKRADGLALNEDEQGLFDETVRMMKYAESHDDSEAVELLRSMLYPS